MNRIFLLSPAHSGGQRAGWLTRPGASFELARRLQIHDATLGEVFAFCSGLYFRGKLAYAQHFCQPPPGVKGVYIITSSRGLVPEHQEIGLKEMEEFSRVAVDVTVPAFQEPLRRSVRELVSAVAGTKGKKKGPKALPPCEFVLLGSIATGKYVDALLPLLGDTLKFPEEFVGRGDLSRGGLMLKCVRENAELQYALLREAKRQGHRAKRIGDMPQSSTPTPKQ